MRKIPSKTLISVLSILIFFSVFSINTSVAAVNFWTGKEVAYQSLTDKEKALENTRLIEKTCHIGLKDREACVKKMIADINSGIAPDAAAESLMNSRGLTNAERPPVNYWPWPSLSSMLMTGAMWVLVKLLYIISILTNFLVFISGSILDKAVRFSIVDITGYTEIQTGIESVWASVRDILNITFIFILLWISIKTIIGIAGSDVKKLLSGVIVAALLINFSLFITRIFLDGSNYLAVGLYNRVLSTVPIPPSDIGPTRPEISAGITDATRISALYSNTAEEDKKYSAKDEPQKGTTTDDAIKLSIKIILTCILIWAFLTAAFLFVVRIVMFIILMVLSPIGFAGEIIPYLKPSAKKWWDTLFDQSLVAPVFMLFLVIILEMSSSSAFSVASDQPLDTTAYFNFTMIAALLIVSVRITKKLSGEAGAAMSKLGAGALGMGLGLATGLAATGLRRTLGAGLAKAAESDKMKKWASNSRLGSTIRATALYGSKSTFDLRNTPVGGLTKKIGVDLGKGGKKGYSDLQEDYAKKQSEKARGLLRENLTEGDAVDEFRSAHQYTDQQRLDDRAKGINLANKLSSEQNIEKRKKIQKEIADHEAAVKEKEAKKELLDKASKKDQYGNLLQDKDSVDARKSILEERKKAYQNQYAQKLSREANFFNHKKAAANKIRKGKTEEESFIEAARKLAEKQQRQAQQAGNNQNQTNNPGSQQQTGPNQGPTTPAANPAP